MTQKIEKCHEHYIDLYILFIDSKHAFNTINRKKIVEVVRDMGIPNKLIRLTQMTIQNARAKIIADEGTTSAISVRRGIRQGDALSGYR